MNITELEAIVAGGEDAQVEFKRTTGQRSDGAKTVCGMLNGSGGFVLFGVMDDGRIVGMNVTTRTVEDVVQELRRIEPFPPVEPELVEIAENRAVLALRVPGGSGRIHTYDGRPFHRVGPTTSPMPPAEYRRRVLEEMHPVHRWEVQPAGVTIADLDESEIARTLEESVRRGRLSDPGTRVPEEILRGLHLMRDGQILNAAVVLFARADATLPSFPQCSVRLARFEGITTAAFLDNRQFHGNLFELLRVTQSFLREQLPIAGRIQSTVLEREDDPLYPTEAIREALANAFAHRDYGLIGGSVSVAVFDDRLEIASPGGLHFGLTPADLIRPHVSRPWNPLIASVLYRRGIIEQWGRGTLRMRELFTKAGLALPEFEERTGDLVVRFRPSRYVAPHQVEHALRPLQRELLAQLGTFPEGASLSQLQGSLQARTPRRTLQDALRMLRELGLVWSSGHARGARWHLTDARIGTRE